MEIEKRKKKKDRDYLRQSTPASLWDARRRTCSCLDSPSSASWRPLLRGRLCRCRIEPRARDRDSSACTPPRTLARNRRIVPESWTGLIPLQARASPADQEISRHFVIASISPGFNIVHNKYSYPKHLPAYTDLSFHDKSRSTEETGFQRGRGKLGRKKSSVESWRVVVPWRAPSAPRPSDLLTSRASDPPVTTSDTSPTPSLRTSDRTCLYYKRVYKTLDVSPIYEAYTLLHESLYFSKRTLPIEFILRGGLPTSRT